jgi:hypothetical protein
MMEESQEGVDWHRDGVDAPWWLVVILTAVMAVPALGAGVLIVVAWLA